MDIVKRIKDILEKRGKKKLIENAVIIIIVGIIAIIAGGVFLNNDKESGKDSMTSQTPASVEVAQNLKASPESETEAALREVLSQMEGVGKLDIMITFSVGKESVPAYNIKKNESSTNEKDSDGGTRSIDENSFDSTLVFEDAQSGGKKPVIIKEVQPVVKGVLIVAEGASDLVVREKLAKAVQVVLDIPLHKVQVTERKK